MATNKGGERPGLNTDDELSVDHGSEGIDIHGWKEQLTLRVFIIGFIVGSFLTIILMKLSLSFSFTVPFNLQIAPLSLILLQTLITALDSSGLFKNPTTRQEITAMQGCVVGFASIVYYGSFADYLFAMSELMAKEFKTGRDENNWTTLKPGWIIIYLFLVCFIGLFTIIPAAKATTLLITSISSTLLAGSRTEGKFYSSLTPTFLAFGLICPHSLVFSFFIGAIISWGIFWPFINSKEGIWYPKETSTNQSVIDGSYGYRVSLTSALFLGEGIFQLILLALHTFNDMYLKKKLKRFIVPLREEEQHQQQQQDIDYSQILTATTSYDDQLRTKLFLKDQIPTPISIGGFLLTATISAVTIPFIFPQIEPRHIATAYIAAPIINFCNAYTVGIFDFSFAPRYGKLAIFVFGSWIGLSHGGVLGGLIASNIIVAVMSSASSLIQNFKLAYMTFTSPRSLFIGQVIGTAMGCVIAPIVFFYFYNLPNFGDGNSEYGMGNARLSRALAVLAAHKLDRFPTHCLTLAGISFMVSLSLNMVKEMARLMNWRFYAYIPSPVAMAIPFFFNAANSLDVCLGSLVVYVWKWRHEKSANLYTPTVATGLFMGEAFWFICVTLLSNTTPPMCVRFFSRDDYMSFQENLNSLPS
ncbi:hypothetical protein J5N97_023753 [Dioscorea zingiberensis]|uniref:Uncharacterized protein n=1 Tax=Dioscorea zingiberensis TaxID=325984 RepID=A0A9D5C549_9LILI|nr:hypothetical protein J5N97_023753 [Dioscorea zingiberensis]